MSAAQVDALSGTYGTVTGCGADRIPDDILRDTLAKFGDAMSEDDKQALIAVYAESGPSADRVTEVRGNAGLVLSYLADSLIEIMLGAAQRPVLLGGQDIFSLTGSAALTHLERLNGGPGRYCGTEAAFDDLAISADGFCITDPAADVRTLDGSDERFVARTFTLRPEPYRPEGEMDRFVYRSFEERG